MSGVMTSAEDYTRMKINAIGVLKDSDIGRGEEETTVAQLNVDEWMKEIKDKGWTELDWFNNVEEGRGLGSDDDKEMDGSERVGAGGGSVMGPVSSNKRKRALIETDVTHENTLLAGLGTMVIVFTKIGCRFH